jgi:ABC-type branched-subunit amino acid transport system substrate-binding protein
MNRSNVRDAIQTASVETIQGKVTFDENGDLNSRVVSVFQYKHNKDAPDDDVVQQQQYIGTAPES